MRTLSEFVDSLTHHVPDAETADHMGLVRDGFIDLALVLDDFVPDSRELALAQTSIETALMWAIKAMALYGLKGESNGC
jgi:hypothetical protein